MRNPFAPHSRPRIPEISTYELKEKLDEGTGVLVLDVRTPSEFEKTNIGGMLLPLAELESRIDELNAHRDKEIVVVCRSGARSAAAVAMLRNAGYDNAVNLRGGLMAWSETIDSSIPRY